MSGVENIIDMIIEQVMDEERKIIEEAQKYQSEKLLLAQDKAQQQYQDKIEKAQKEADAIIERFKSGLKLQRKHRLLETKDAILKEAFKRALDETAKLVDAETYPDIVRRLVIDGAVTLGVEDVELVFPKDHRPKLDLKSIAQEIEKTTGKSIKIKVSDETIRSRGGVIIRASDGTKWVDNTIEARLERYEEKMRDAVSRKLFP